MKKSNLKTQDEKNEFDELKHDMNNHLSIVGFFLNYSQNIQNDELFKELLKNAEKSFGEILRIYEKF